MLPGPFRVSHSVGSETYSNSGGGSYRLNGALEQRFQCSRGMNFLIVYVPMKSFRKGSHCCILNELSQSEHCPLSCLSRSAKPPVMFKHAQTNSSYSFWQDRGNICCNTHIRNLVYNRSHVGKCFKKSNFNCKTCIFGA